MADLVVKNGVIPKMPKGLTVKNADYEMDHQLKSDTFYDPVAGLITERIIAYPSENATLFAFCNTRTTPQTSWYVARLDNVSYTVTSANRRVATLHFTPVEAAGMSLPAPFAYTFDVGSNLPSNYTVTDLLAVYLDPVPWGYNGAGGKTLYKDGKAVYAASTIDSDMSTLWSVIRSGNYEPLGGSIDARMSDSVYGNTFTPVVELAATKRDHKIANISLDFK